MTEEDVRSLNYAIYGEEYSDYDHIDFTAMEFFSQKAQFEIERFERVWGYPNGWAHLLSRGFDLFGLIESGEAIDKTKLK